MLSRVRNLALVAALAVVGFVAANTAAMAQTYCHCDIVDGCKVITYYDAAGNVTGQETVCPGTGGGDFDCQFVEIPPTGPLNVSIPPVKISANTNSPTYGAITTNYDPSRPASNATIVSVDGRNRFPARVRFSFHAISNVAGIDYCSRTELVFVNDAVNSFNPFNKERFCLESPVEFYRCDDPDQVTAFVLEPGATCVTLN